MATSLNALGTLANLERLYLARGQNLDSLAFLANLKKLKHLQIQAQVRPTLSGSGFGVCTNLESIRFFGTPDPQTIGELKTLKKLQRVDIVGDELVFEDAAELARLRSQLPAIEIRVIAPDNAEPELSERWKQHVRRVRAAAIKRLDAKISAENDAATAP